MPAKLKDTIQRPDETVVGDVTLIARINTFRDCALLLTRLSRSSRQVVMKTLAMMFDL